MRKCSCESVDLLGIYARAPLGLVRETEWANIEREIVSVKEIRINAPWTFWQRIVLHTTHQHITYTEWESIWVCDKESESVDERKREGDRCIIWGMELFNRRRWRLVSAQWSNKSSYASSCPISIILHYGLPHGQTSSTSTKELHDICLCEREGDCCCCCCSGNT